MTMKMIQQGLIERCKLLDLQLQCGSDGAFGSEVAIVMDAPGDREVQMRTPLVGGAGNLVWTALRKYGLNKMKVYTTNLVKRQMLFDERKTSVAAGELQHWQSLLNWELSQLPNLKYILVLGGPSLKALCGQSPITMWRGSVLDINIKHIEEYQKKAERNNIATIISQ